MKNIVEFINEARITFILKNSEIKKDLIAAGYKEHKMEDKYDIVPSTVGEFTCCARTGVCINLGDDITFWMNDKESEKLKGSGFIACFDGDEYHLGERRAISIFNKLAVKEITTQDFKDAVMMK